jgi:hypothetical protein
MSSAVIASMIWLDWRFRSTALARLARNPVTTMSAVVSSAPLAAACSTGDVPSGGVDT